MKYQFAPFNAFLGLWRDQGKSKIQNFEIMVSKANTSFQIFLYYWHLTFYHHWYMKCKTGPFLTQFGVKDVASRVITTLFRDSHVENKPLTSNFHQILISIFLSRSIHDIQLWALFTQFRDNDVTKEISIP